ncbi:MAG: hypothetical protein RSE46_11240 [Janthinobacterium sp.]
METSLEFQLDIQFARMAMEVKHGIHFSPCRALPWIVPDGRAQDASAVHDGIFLIKIYI